MQNDKAIRIDRKYEVVCWRFIYYDTGIIIESIKCFGGDFKEIKSESCYREGTLDANDEAYLK